ncbi:MAG: SDR family NAD(P)-dependent oxidoreductase [Burkholderiaceae bacterium]|nr:MAG: SDR family NAD(P)-dependent oxidoreductase [Burkholderiaceae bacterium]
MTGTTADIGTIETTTTLSGKTALVTGSGRGIGRGIALSLAQAGADVAVADLDHGMAQETAALVEKAGRRSVALHVDVTQTASVTKMVKDVESTLGPLDIASNNAGVIGIYPIEKLTATEWDRVMAVNLRGVFLCTQAEINVMRTRHYGRIVNTASIAGKVGFPGISHYSASKFAVIGFTNAVAKEVATDGITVNALCPGIVGTAMWRGDTGLAEKWKEEAETEEQSWARQVAAFIPQQQAQTPDDMGRLVVYLANAEHVTGQAIAVDGGFSL